MMNDDEWGGNDGYEIIAKWKRWRKIWERAFRDFLSMHSTNEWIKKNSITGTNVAWLLQFEAQEKVEERKIWLCLMPIFMLD